MGDLRFRAFRMKSYAGLCPRELSPAQRQEMLLLLDRQDEDGMRAFFGSLVLEAQHRRALALLDEARTLGDRLNMMDRTLPALPHAEITATYNRLRALGDELGEMETQEPRG